MNQVTTVQSGWLVHIDILPSDVADLIPMTLSADRTPALVYLSSMAKRSRRVMWDGLRIATEILMVASPLTFTPESFPWWQQRYAHVNALRAILVETRSPATGNRVLYAIKGVLKACWRLELLGPRPCPLSEVEILATADAMTPRANMLDDLDREATSVSYARGILEPGKGSCYDDADNIS